MLSMILDMLSHMLFFALHLVSPGSFPRPLSAAQEKEALVRFRENNDQAARNLLIEHNLRLVAHIAKKYSNSTADPDDLISIGTIGLIKAVGTFDHTKGARLATYASRCIENEILMYFRAGKKTAQDVSLSEPIDTDKDGHPLSLLDVIAAEDTLAEDLETKLNAEKLRRFLDEALDDREKAVIEWRYGLKGNGMPQREVAKMLGISRSYISRIEKKALSKLRDRFENG